MTELARPGNECIDRIQEILRCARVRALQSVNTTMVSAYWEIGREIVEEEQRGEERAEYGSQLLIELSAKLSAEFGGGFGERTLRRIRQFYLSYRDRVPALRFAPDSTGSIRSPAVPKSAKAPAGRIRSPVVSKSGPRPLEPNLSWSHYIEIMRLSKPEARSFYETECGKAGWSKRELQRQIGSMLFERLALSKDKDGVLALAQDGHEVQTASDLVKDPYVLEFTGLPERTRFQESDLEQALIERLQHFLLELGRDLFFVARQKRITIDGDHFYIDLVFYHRVLRCFLLIDLKVTRLTQQDVGQMLLYTGYYEQEEMRESENPPIGLILCAEKNDAVVRYTLSKTASQIFASRYQLHLPSEDELAQELRRERLLIEGERKD